MSTCVRPQAGESASTTRTFVSATSPVFVTVIVNVAVPPFATVCSFGFFTIAIAGCETGMLRGGSHAPARAG